MAYWFLGLTLGIIAVGDTIICARAHIPRERESVVVLGQAASIALGYCAMEGARRLWIRGNFSPLCVALSIAGFFGIGAACWLGYAWLVNADEIGRLGGKGVTSATAPFVVGQVFSHFMAEARLRARRKALLQHVSELGAVQESPHARLK